MRSGIRRHDISLLTKNEHGEQVESNLSMNAAQGFVSGVTAGGIIGMVIGFLIGEGTLSFTGINWFLVMVPVAHAIGLSGVFATTLSGLILGATAGGLLGMLMGISIPDNEVFTYQEQINSGESILAVKSPEFREQQVQDILQEFDAYQIQTRQVESRRAPRADFFSPYSVIGFKGGKSKRKIIK